MDGDEGAGAPHRRRALSLFLSGAPKTGKSLLLTKVIPALLREDEMFGVGRAAEARVDTTTRFDRRNGAAGFLCSLLDTLIELAADHGILELAHIQKGSRAYSTVSADLEDFMVGTPEPPSPAASCGRERAHVRAAWRAAWRLRPEHEHAPACTEAAPGGASPARGSAVFQVARSRVASRAQRSRARAAAAGQAQGWRTKEMPPPVSLSVQSCLRSPRRTRCGPQPEPYKTAAGYPTREAR